MCDYFSSSSNLSPPLTLFSLFPLQSFYNINVHFLHEFWFPYFKKHVRIWIQLFTTFSIFSEFLLMLKIKSYSLKYSPDIHFLYPKLIDKTLIVFISTCMRRTFGIESHFSYKEVITCVRLALVKIPAVFSYVDLQIYSNIKNLGFFKYDHSVSCDYISIVIYIFAMFYSPDHPTLQSFSRLFLSWYHWSSRMSPLPWHPIKNHVRDQRRTSGGSHLLPWERIYFANHLFYLTSISPDSISIRGSIDNILFCINVASFSKPTDGSKWKLKRSYFFK